MGVLWYVVPCVRRGNGSYYTQHCTRCAAHRGGAAIILYTYILNTARRSAVVPYYYCACIIGLEVARGVDSSAPGGTNTEGYTASTVTLSTLYELLSTHTRARQNVPMNEDFASLPYSSWPFSIRGQSHKLVFEPGSFGSTLPN